VAWAVSASATSKTTVSVILIFTDVAEQRGFYEYEILQPLLLSTCCWFSQPVRSHISHLNHKVNGITLSNAYFYKLEFVTLWSCCSKLFNLSAASAYCDHCLPSFHTLLLYHTCTSRIIPYMHFTHYTIHALHANPCIIFHTLLLYHTCTSR